MHNLYFEPVKRLIPINSGAMPVVRKKARFSEITVGLKVIDLSLSSFKTVWSTVPHIFKFIDTATCTQDSRGQYYFKCALNMYQHNNSVISNKEWIYVRISPVKVIVRAQVALKPQIK